MKLSDLEKIHASPESWIFGVIYFSRHDPRLVVRKRIGSLGWTLNFARPLAIPLLVGSLAFLWLTVSTLADLNLSKPVKWSVTAVLVGALITVWARLARPGRYLDR